MRAVVPLLLLALLAVGCSRREPAPEPVRAVRTMTVTADTAGGVHEYAAEVRARTESRLGFRVGGKMTSRLVDVGDVVRPGQVLARLDPQDLRLGDEAARAAVQAAQVNADLAAADFKRFSDLKHQGFISAAELDRRETTLKAAQAQLAQARAQSGVQGNQASYASLVADVGGVVTAVDAEPGAVLSSGTSVLRLAHDGPRDAVFAVPEDRAAGMRALAGRPDALRVRLWGQPDATLRATVREVAAAADPTTRTFLVKADIGKADVKIGQTVTVLEDLPRLPGIAKLPLTAVMQQQGRTAVWLFDAATQTVKMQPIEVGGADGNAVVVVGGLSPGQQVVTAGVHVLTPGQQVTLYGQPPAMAAAGPPASAAR